MIRDRKKKCNELGVALTLLGVLTLSTPTQDVVANTIPTSITQEMIDNLPDGVDNYGFIIYKQDDSVHPYVLLTFNAEGKFYYDGGSLHSSESPVTLCVWEDSAWVPNNEIPNDTIITQDIKIFSDSIYGSTPIYADNTFTVKTFTPNVPMYTSEETQVNIESGELTYIVPTINNFPSFKLIEQIKTDVFASFVDTLKITDTRGTHEGWTLKVSATQFETIIDGNVHKLSRGSLFLSKPLITSDASISTPSLTTRLTDLFTPIDSGTTTIVKALEGFDGINTELDFGTKALQLLVDPKNVIVDKTTNKATYKTTITWSLMNAPE